MELQQHIEVTMSQDTGKHRISTKEQFYTKDVVARNCVNKILEVCNDNDYVWIEPSAGSGSFSKLVKCVAFDIDPKDESIIKQDFLEWTPDISKKYITFGNPPFGKQSSLAKRFIRHASSFSNIIAFILPRSFVKPSMNRVFPLNFHCLVSEDVPKNSFYVNEAEYDVPCVFQIWKRMDHNRMIIPSQKEEGFKYVKNTEPHTIVVRRVGVNAGRCFIAYSSTFSPQSHYFIKLEKGDMQTIVDAFNSTEFPSNTVGPRSLSKTEITDFLVKFTTP